MGGEDSILCYIGWKKGKTKRKRAVNVKKD